MEHPTINLSKRRSHGRQKSITSTQVASSNPQTNKPSQQRASVSCTSQKQKATLAARKPGYGKYRMNRDQEESNLKKEYQKQCVEGHEDIGGDGENVLSERQPSSLHNQPSDSPIKFRVSPLEIGGISSSQLSQNRQVTQRNKENSSNDETEVVSVSSQVLGQGQLSSQYNQFQQQPPLNGPDKAIQSFDTILSEGSQTSKKFVLSYMGAGKNGKIKVLEADQIPQEIVDPFSRNTAIGDPSSNSNCLSSHVKAQASQTSVKCIQPPEQHYYTNKHSFTKGVNSSKGTSFAQNINGTPGFNSCSNSKQASNKSSFAGYTTKKIEDHSHARHTDEKEIHQQKDILVEYINLLMTNFSLYSLEQQQKLEDLIIQLHSFSKNDNGVVPEDFKRKLYNLKDELLQGQRKRKENENEVNATFQDYKNEIPEILKGKNHLLGEFVDVYEDYQQALEMLSIKTLQSFKDAMYPSKLERSIGEAFMLLSANIDKKITLTSDKKTTLDKGWEATAKYVNNSGKVIQNCQQIKECIDAGDFSPSHIEEIRKCFKSSALDEEKMLAVAPKQMLQYLKSVVRYYDFLKQAGRQGRRESTVSHGPPKIDESFQPYDQQSLENASKYEKDGQWEVAAQNICHPQRKLIELTPLYDEFKYAVNSKIFQEGSEFDKGLQAERQDLQSAKKVITQLKSKEKLIRWNMERKQKAIDKEAEKDNNSSYMRYQEELRRKFLSFIKERILEQRRSKLADNKELIFDKRLQRMRDNATYKLQMIEQFKQTLEDIEWNDKLRAEVVQQRKAQHLEFIENLMKDKVYKQEVYAAQRIIDHEERMARRRSDMDFEHMSVMKQQDEVLHDLELLSKAGGF